MGTSNQRYSVVMAKRVNCVPSEEVACSSGWNRPPFYQLRVRPKQVAHDTFLGNFSEPIYFFKIVDFLNVWGESSVHTENLVVDDCGDSEIVEDLGKSSPDIQRAVLFNALVIEAVNLGDESWLVISSEEGDSVFIAHLQGEEKEESFDTVSSSIDVVPKENVVGVGRIATNFEQFEQIVKLSVNVSAYGHGRS